MRAGAVLALSVGVGLRAKGVGQPQVGRRLRPGGAYPESHAPQGGAYTKGGRTRDVFVSSPALRRVLEKYGERHGVLSARASQAALFPSQKGGGR